MRSVTTIFIFMILFPVISFPVISSAQCSNEKIIPLKMGISKAEAIAALKGRSDIANVFDYGSVADSLKFCYKRKYAYMKDTAWISRIRFNYKGNFCLGSDDNDVKLVFCNNRLYGVEVSIYYTKDEYKNCVANYKRILAEFKEALPFQTEFDLTYDVKKITVGEGLSFFRNKQESKKPKFERTDVLYRARKVSTEAVLPEKLKDAKEMYAIEINYVNLVYSEFNSSRF